MAGKYGAHGGGGFGGSSFGGGIQPGVGTCGGGRKGPRTSTKDESFFDQLQEDMDNFDWDNTDINHVYQAHYISAYKGVLVVRIDDESLTSAYFGGIIYLNHKYDRMSPETKENMLKHEYGHYLQEQEMGTDDFITYVAIPSLMMNIASRSNSVLHDNYHNFPWEYDADVRGGVSRMHADWAPEISERYFSSIKNR